MAILDILEFPDRRLRTKARPVKVIDTSIKQLAENMLETMYAAPGVGLAATQVDIHLRLIVVDISEEQNQPQVFINPEIVRLADDLKEYNEGCLSVPGFHEPVKRYEHILVSALDLEGQAFEIKPEGLLSVCIQHEIDHLNGKLFVDYLSPLKRLRIRSKLEKQHRHKD